MYCLTQCTASHAARPHIVLLHMLQGHMMYYGQGSGAAAWFEALGHPVPFGVNVADFILDIASGEIVAKEQ